MKSDNIYITEIGKIPPQNIELEEAILGAILLESDSFLDIVDILKPESFYKESNQLIYKSILNLFSKNKPIDLLTVSEQLRYDKNIDIIGGYTYLTELTSKIGSASHIEYHARIIQQKFIQRELIRISTEIQKKAFDESIDIEDLIEFSEKKIFDVSIGSLKSEPILINTISKEQIHELEEKYKSGVRFYGIGSGIVSLDKITNGFHNEKLIIIAGRPAMGKSAFVVSLAINQALDLNKNVAIFSLEMGSKEIWNRMISNLTWITNAKIVNGNINQDEWIKIENATRKLEDADIYIDDTPAISLTELRAKARKLKLKKNIDIIYIDYLQLMTGTKEKNGNREQEISSITRGLKALCKELDIPIIALSQLNRSVEARGDKKPQLSDLRESGAIEQDADIVGFIYRAEYYGINQYESGESTLNKVDIIISKNRDGLIGEVSLNRTYNFSKIYDESFIEDIKPIDNSDLQENINF